MPFYTSREARSIGTSTAIPDPIEHRMVEVLSMTEYYQYWLLRWDDNTKYIREQYLLDTDYMNKIRVSRGLRTVPQTICYTTDFLVDEMDGRRHAYFVKMSRRAFDRNSIQYRGKLRKYMRMMERMSLEKEYWESQDVDFSIVTMDDINRKLAVNIAYVMEYYNDMFCKTLEQKLLYLNSFTRNLLYLDSLFRNDGILESVKYHVLVKASTEFGGKK